MWHRLALSLGLSNKRAQEELSPDEFNSWCAYYQIQPFGEQRQDFRFGMMLSMMANIHRQKGGKSYRPFDFMPWADRPQMTSDQMHRNLAQFAKMHNARMKAKRN
jgi:hypothetical protein